MTKALKTACSSELTSSTGLDEPLFPPLADQFHTSVLSDPLFSWPGLVCSLAIRQSLHHYSRFNLDFTLSVKPPQFLWEIHSSFSPMAIGTCKLHYDFMVGSHVSKLLNFHIEDSNGVLSPFLFVKTSDMTPKMHPDSILHTVGEACLIKNDQTSAQRVSRWSPWGNTLPLPQSS